MNKCINIILLCAMCACGALLVSCDDDDDAVGEVKPDAIGTFVDSRDGREYHWARFGNLEWMCENGKYFINDENICTVYQDAGWGINDPISKKNQERYGCLYTLSGAIQAAPEGWRVPTDEDWQNLERHFGMSGKEASVKNWRGNVARSMMAVSTEGPALAIQCAGYFTQRVLLNASGYRFMACYGFYWTSTKDEDRDGELYFYRKFFYNGNQVYRQSAETDMQKMNVRYVRDAVNDMVAE